jgi:hypothetical protein
VNNIFSSSRQQVTEAQKIARNMQVLKEISTQTAESTTRPRKAFPSSPVVGRDAPVRIWLPTARSTRAAPGGGGRRSDRGGGGGYDGH